jgi:23S rRNA pseudouridine1911/1915/1917 synthase
MDFKIIYEDQDVMVVDKPAGVVVFPEGQTTKDTLIDALLEQYPDLKSVGEAPRYGVVHRLDKDTSGVLLVAKSAEGLIFLQKQFKNREVEKKYLALATGVIKDDFGAIKTFIGRSPGDPRKQVVLEDGEREAITEYRVLQRFTNYTLLEVNMKTGRKHQIRCHLAYIHHPIAGDALYGFKDSPKPEGLARQFLHASYIKIHLPSGKVQEFNSELPEDLKNILNKLT